MSKGYVYILSNPSMPGIVKIGRTTRSVDQRASELQQTGVPTPFQIKHWVYSPNCLSLEARMHEIFSAARVSQSREFFACDAIEASNVLDAVHLEHMSELIGEFLPDHILVDSCICINPDVVHRLAFALGEHPYSMAVALEELSPEDVTTALSKYKAKCEERAAEMKRKGIRF